MKKLFFAFVAVVALGLTSCKDCVDCTSIGGEKICKDDYQDALGISWDTYKSAAKAAGCK